MRGELIQGRLSVMATNITDPFLPQTTEFHVAIPTSGYPFLAAAAATRIIVAVVITIVNALILHAILRMRKKRRVVHLFLAHLAVADILLGAMLAMERIIALVRHDLTSRFECMPILWLGVISAGASISGILCVSISTYNTVLKLQSPNAEMPKRVALMMISAAWGFWTLFLIVVLSVSPTNSIQAQLLQPCYVGNGFFNIISLQFLSFMLMVTQIVSTLVQIRTSVLVQKYLKETCSMAQVQGVKGRQPQISPSHMTYASSVVDDEQILSPRTLTMCTSNQIQNISAIQSIQTLQSINPISTSVSLYSSKPGTAPVTKQPLVAKKLRTLRSTVRVLALVTVIFAISWLPIFVVMMLFFFCPDGCGVDGYVMQVMELTLGLNAIVNFPIYWVKDRELRNIFRNMFGCKHT